MATPAIYATDGQGFPTQYAQKIENIIASQQGDNVTITTAAGDALVAIAIGLRANDRFDDFHSGYAVGSGTAAGYFRALPDSVSANPVISDSSVASITSITETNTALTLTSVAASVGATAVYTGTITGGGTNNFVGYYFQVAGFTGANNNGYFICTANSTTTLTLANNAATAETHAATATSYIVAVSAVNNFVAGEAVALSALAPATWLNGQSQAVLAFPAPTGTGFSINDSSKHAAQSAQAQTSGVAAGSETTDWSLITNLNMTGIPATGSTGGGSDYTPGATPPAVPNPYPASNWSIDGYYPSMYIWSATGVTAGTHTINLKSTFSDPASTSDLSAGAQAAGRPIFQGGVTFLVIRFSGVLGSAAGDGSSIGNTVAASAAAPAFATTQGAELLLSVGLMKSGNVFGLGHVNQGGTDTADAVSLIASGKLVGSEAHYAVEIATPASGSGTTKLYFSNPLGYEMLVGTIALKHS